MVLPFVVMSRTSRPNCPWQDAIVLSNAEQRRWRVPILSNAVTGFHSKDSKAVFIAWLSQSNYTHAWHVEEDARIDGSHPHVIGSQYENSSADIIGMSWPRQVGGWVERTCTICTRDNVLKIAWPLVRISRRLAKEVVKRIQNGARGHHEVLIGTICMQTPWCHVDVNSNHGFIGQIEASGGHRKKFLTTALEPGKVYHPFNCKKNHSSDTGVVDHI